MHISNELIEDGISYIYYSIIGQYLLVKYAGEGDIGALKKELIRKAYVESNMSIQEYVEDLDSECRICGMELNYVKREKMKAYLSEVMW